MNSLLHLESVTSAVLRPSPSIFVYCKGSITGGVEGLGTRLIYTSTEGAEKFNCTSRRSGGMPPRKFRTKGLHPLTFQGKWLSQTLVGQLPGLPDLLCHPCAGVGGYEHSLGSIHILVVARDSWCCHWLSFGSRMCNALRYHVAEAVHSSSILSW